MKPAARPTLAASVDLPDTDHVGESILQALISELLRPLIERYLRERGVRAFVGADQFFYYKQDDVARRPTRTASSPRRSAAGCGSSAKPRARRK